MENLPEDVLSKIFISFRAKQLAQMRCICKSLNAYLSQSSFIESHLHHSIHNNDGILLVFSSLYPFNSESFTTHPSRSPHKELTSFIKFPFDTQSNHGRGKIIGSVNGLICFKYDPNHDSEAIYIWNPSLSAVLTLPPYSVPFHSNKWITMNLLRFGFDPKSDDYKVVKFTITFKVEDLFRFGFHPDNSEYRGIRKCKQIEVYSMRKGSWKLITQNIPSNLEWLYDHDDLSLYGHHPHLHWLGKTDFGGNCIEVIVAFDLGTETFHEIPLPESIRGDYANYLGVLGGKLCVISKVPSGKREVWVMDEYGAAESWVKHHVLPSFSGDFKPRGFTLHNELLFQAERQRLALYDPVAEKTKIFEFRGGYDWAGKVVEYVDSLVWVTPPKQWKIISSINSLTLNLKRFLYAFWGLYINNFSLRTLMIVYIVWFWILVIFHLYY